MIQGGFFLSGPPLKMSLDWPPPNLFGLPPPINFSKCWNHIHFARHLGVFRSEGASLGLITFFWNQLLTGQHSANSGETYLKKNHPVDLQYMLLIHLQLRGNYYPVNVKESHKKYPFFWANIAQIGSPPPNLIWTLFFKSDLRWLSTVFSSYCDWRDAPPKKEFNFPLTEVSEAH